MKEVRSGLFETNSSSIHAIVIRRDSKPKLPEELNPKNPYYLGYAWEVFGGNVRTIEEWKTKAIYLHVSGLNTNTYYENPEPIKLIESWFKSIGLVVECNDDGMGYSIIDHPEEIQYFAEMISKRPDLMLSFVFNPKSKIYTAMDSDSDSMAYKILDNYSDGGVYCGVPWMFLGKKRNSVVLYGKGN